jgi:hypothetical protein
MTILAFASGDINPIANQNVDPTLDLSAIVLPSNVQVYGDAVDDANPAAVFTFQWYVMWKPTGSIAALDDAALQAPTLEDVDTWGNYRLFLVATNTVTLETSEQDPLRAASSSFCVVRTLSVNQGIQKPSAGERNWFDDIYVWADRIEDFTAGMAPHNIIDHLDVTNGTGPDLEALSQGNYADDPELDPGLQNPSDAWGNRKLHRHHGGDVDIANRLGFGPPGVVFLDPAFSGNPLEPTAITEDIFTFTAHTWHTMGSQFSGLIAKIDKGRTPQGGVQEALFYFPLASGFSYTILDYSVVFNVVAPQSTYSFDLVEIPLANPLAGVQMAGSLLAGWTPNFANVGLNDVMRWSEFSNMGAIGNFGPIPDTSMVGFRVTQCEDVLDRLCSGITVTIVCKRG